MAGIPHKWAPSSPALKRAAQMLLPLVTSVLVRRLFALSLR